MDVNVGMYWGCFFVNSQQKWKCRANLIVDWIIQKTKMSKMKRAENRNERLRWCSTFFFFLFFHSGSFACYVLVFASVYRLPIVAFVPFFVTVDVGILSEIAATSGTSWRGGMGERVCLREREEMKAIYIFFIWMESYSGYECESFHAIASHEWRINKIERICVLSCEWIGRAKRTPDDNRTIRCRDVADTSR